MTKITYTYTIFDGNPAESGPCHWPSHEQVEVRGRSPETVAERALAEARRVARRSGEYQKGDALWVLVWDQDGVSWQFHTAV